jgi:filamentous hemagglutinin
LLDAAHPQNQTKANWFGQALGFDQSNWQDLASRLRFDPATAVATKTTQYGQT